MQASFLPTVCLRKPTQEEFLKISQFSFENFVNETSLSTGQSKSSLAKKLGAPPIHKGDDDIWFVVTLAEKLIGFIWIQKNSEGRYAFGYDIYLEPEYRSKGFGRDIMLQCKNKLKAAGIDTVKICVYEHNQIARRLYDSLGFKVEKYDEQRKQFTLSMSLADT